MFIVVGYYTKDTLYEQQAERFMASLLEYKIPCHVKAIDNLGDWHKNTSYKPTFIRECMAIFPDLDIVYVDCDAEFMSYPDLFDTLDCNIAVHYFDRKHHGRHCSGFEILSGTIFLKNNNEMRALVEKWEARCKHRPYIWDQKNLAAVIGKDYYNLPEEYCTINITMGHVKEPVIVHYQASRLVRANKMKLVL